MKERRPETIFEKKQVNIIMAKSTADWIDRVCTATNKSRSWIIEDLLLDCLPIEYQQSENEVQGPTLFDEGERE